MQIKSDNFTLNADDVKIYFEKSLYDIKEIDAQGNVDFNSSEFKMSGSGEAFNFLVFNEKLKIEGLKSKLIAEDIKMTSDGFIEVNNANGNFSVKGLNSKLVNESIIIIAESIDGKFSNNNEISLLNVVDKKISYVKNNEIEMYAKKINFDNKSSIIELIDKVTIIRNEEKITGDYGTLNTKNNSYKMKSNKQSKVKVIIQNNE